jgi:hypothetical protein
MRIILLVSLLAFATGPAYADATRDALEEIAKCAVVADSAERLKCYDAAAPRVKNALTAPAPQAKDKGSLLDWFGFSRSPKPAQKAEEFGKPAPPPGPEEITEITAIVLELAKTARGRAIFILDNGQVWRQLDADSTDLPYPPAGTTMKATIETGFLGSYNLTIAGRNGLIKVFRMK